jgi:hypothetical protein
LKFFAALRKPQVALPLIAVTLVLAFVIKGTYGLVGMAAGLIAAAFNLWALAGILKLGSEAAVAGPKGPKVATAFIVFAFFCKLPVFILLGLFTKRLGDPAPGCFLVGVGLVYSAVVGSALASS